MPREDQVERLLRRVEALEDSLEQYHTWLEASIERDRTFLLRELWGLIAGIVTLLGVGAAMWLMFDYIGSEGLVTAVVGAALYVLCVGFAHWLCNKGRESDEKMLSQLPSWNEIQDKNRRGLP